MRASITNSFYGRPVSHLTHRFIIDHYKWMTEQEGSQLPFCIESDEFAPEREDIGRFWIKFQSEEAETVSFYIGNYNSISVVINLEFVLLNSRLYIINPVPVLSS